MSATAGWAERRVRQTLRGLESGSLLVRSAAGDDTYGSGRGPAATLVVHDSRFFRRALAGGEMGLGESYMDGDWSTPDLVALIRVMLANRHMAAGLPRPLAGVLDLADALRHRLRDNTRRGSRANIRRHYDLGNSFFELFLDANLMYSCAVFDRADDSLEQAQVNKLRVICDQLALGPQDHVLEIGTGWGGFALFAATRYGCRVTTTTISAEQHACAAARFREAGAAGERIHLLAQDYRDVRGSFDKIVSIEMFEAVGLRHYDAFFAACNRLLHPEGQMLLQAITVDDWRFAEYRRSPNWIAKHIFPGAELASVAEILASLARVARLSLHHTRQIGTHYARTLHHWRRRFLARVDEVRAQGFDERFIRMWDLYLAYCEAAFLERHIGDVQLHFTRAGVRTSLPGEPWPVTHEPVRTPNPLADVVGASAS